MTNVTLPRRLRGEGGWPAFIGCTPFRCYLDCFVNQV